MIPQDPGERSICPNDYHCHTGLVMGVFDMFHVGHLRLLQRSKEHCDHLRAAVLSDELVRKFKNHPPVIPEEQRAEILGAVRYVDEVVIIRDDPSRLVEWKRRPFDCFFCGDDYADNEYFVWERKELQKLGADIQFFTYTSWQSSTMIRQAIGKKDESAAGRPADDAGSREKSGSGHA